MFLQRKSSGGYLQGFAVYCNVKERKVSTVLCALICNYDVPQQHLHFSSSLVVGRLDQI